MLDLLQDHIIAGVKVELGVQYVMEFSYWRHIPGIGYRNRLNVIFHINSKGEFCFRRPGKKRVYHWWLVDQGSVTSVETLQEYAVRRRKEMSDEAPRDVRYNPETVERIIGWETDA